MVNKVYLDQDGLLCISVVGDQTETSVREMGEKISFYVHDLRRRGRPVLIYDNLLGMGKATSEARREVARLARLLDFDRGVMVGGGGAPMRYGTNLMLRAIGRRNMRYFSSPEAARDWLVQPLSVPSD